jgi:uncharacterized protein
VKYAYTSGAHKTMEPEYSPMGLTLDGIFTEMPQNPFRDHIWPKFLRETAMRVFKLDDAA